MLQCENETKPEWCLDGKFSGNWWWKDYAAYKISIKESFPSISPTHTDTHTYTHWNNRVNLCRCVFVFIAFMVVTKYKVRNSIAMKINLCFTYIFPLLFLHIYFVRLKMPCIESSFNLNAKLEVNIVRFQTPTTCLSIFPIPKSFMFGFSVSCWHHYFFVMIVIIFCFQCPTCYRVSRWFCCVCYNFEIAAEETDEKMSRETT